MKKYHTVQNSIAKSLKEAKWINLAHIHFPEMLRTLNKKWREYINVREYRRGNQKWTIQRNWQHRVHNTKKNTTQYALDTTMHKQAHTT